MRKQLLPILLLLFSSALLAQSFSSKKQTYALVIGISDYKDEGIKDLNFAHRDAQIFYNFLQTKPGGALPKENIELLVDSVATLAKMYDAFDSLRKKIKKGDKFIFYFAGHGRVETTEFDELGYLLAYDSPPNNFQRNAFWVGDLNRASRTITLKKDAFATFYLDACHAGELAGGDNNGPGLSRSDDELKDAKEIRVMACRKDQQSMELSSLGGGRGLFSYYLVKGLSGEAEKDDDNSISVKELQRYISDNVERIAEEKNHKGGQNPFIDGFNRKTEKKLAFLDPDDLGGEEVASVMTDLSPESSGVKEVVASRGNSETGTYQSFEDAIAQKNLLSPEGNCAYDIYNDLLKSNSKDRRLPALKSKLIISLQDEAQQAINAYLRSDQKELNNRLFIEKSKVYEKYPKYLDVAAKLAGKDYLSYKGIKAKQYYFEGINFRLKNSLKKLSKKNIKTALSLQKKALSFDNKAAYIHNEIGVLNLFLENLEKAEASFQYAMKLSPTWVIPYANLSVLYTIKKDFKNAESWGQQAVDLQPAYIKGQTNLGKAQESLGKYLQAEHHYREGIYYNWDFYDGFERLAYLYTLFGKYNLAEIFFKEMEARKKGIFPGFPAEGQFIEIAPIEMSQWEIVIRSEKELLEKIKKDPNDFKAWQELGQLYELENRFEEAENCFLKVIKIKPTAYQVYEYLGDLYSGTGKDDIFNLLAESNDSENDLKRTDPNLLEKYPETIIWPASNWKRYEEAIAMYKVPIDALDGFEGEAYDCAKKTWRLLEEIERNEEAEDLIELFVVKHPEEIDLLEGFYFRMTDRYPEDADYWYKKGMWYYENRNTEWTTMKNNFEKVIALDSMHPSRSDVFLKLGELYAITGGQAQKDAFDSPKTDAMDDEQFKIYSLYVDDFKKAIAYSESSNKLRPEQLGPKHQLLNQYLAFYQPQKAQVLLKELVDSSLLNFKTRRQTIHTYAWNGQLDKAMPFVNWLEKKPIGLYKEDYHEIAMFYLAKKDYQNAINNFEKMLVLDPGNKNIQYRIATLYALKNEKNKALDWLEKSINNGFSLKKVIAYDPAFDKLRESTDFKNLIEKHKLTTETI